MEVRLSAFEGPFDLLFHLIEKNEIDIQDIPIAELTDQYLAVIASASPDETADMDGMSEFLLMAATLLEIKARLLLPSLPKNADSTETDPRETLVQKLLEYKRCQELAEQLRGYAGAGERLVRGASPILKEAVAFDPSALELEGVSVETLYGLFLDVMRRRERRTDRIHAGFNAVPKDRHTVADQINYLRRCLSERGRLRFNELFESFSSREERVVTFLALLELIRLRQITAYQTAAFEDIELSPVYTEH